MRNKILNYLALVVVITILTIGITNGVDYLISKAGKTGSFLSKGVENYLVMYPGEFNLNVPKAKAVEIVYAYNDQVPTEVVKAEIIKQAKEFNLGEKFMTDLAFCESGFDNLATNDNSTATGVYQYLWGTWKETESWKIKHIARTDYKANIREAMIDISNGEFSKWVDCLK